MYAALWRVLPGPAWLKVIELVAIAAGVLAVLVFLVFPYVADTFFTEGSRLGES